jgi:hypothetical protein
MSSVHRLYMGNFLYLLIPRIILSHRMLRLNNCRPLSRSFPQGCCSLSPHRHCRPRKESGVAWPENPAPMSTLLFVTANAIFDRAMRPNRLLRIFHDTNDCRRPYRRTDMGQATCICSTPGLSASGEPARAEPHKQPCQHRKEQCKHNTHEKHIRGCFVFPREHY